MRPGAEIRERPVGLHKAPDERAAGSAAAQILIDAGHRRIGVVAGPRDAMQGRLRLEGIEATAAAAEQVSLSALTASKRDVSSGFDAARTLLGPANPPTALICTHERLAGGAVLAAASLGVRIPADLSLVSLDDGEQLASGLVPRLTMIARPDRAMAEQAVAMTFQRFEGDTDAPSELTFSCPAVFRDSGTRRRRSQPAPCHPVDR